MSVFDKSTCRNSYARSRLLLSADAPPKIKYPNSDRWKDLSSPGPGPAPNSTKTATRRRRKIRAVFIDELSMLQQIQLHFIDQRLRQACPERGHLFFGGVPVILIGDPGQLPPVGDAEMWKKSDRPGYMRTTRWWRRNHRGSEFGEVLAACAAAAAMICCLD